MTISYNAPVDMLDRDLVLDFFWRFSVFECALKREGFLRAGRNCAAEPDWKKFGECIRDRFKEVSVNGFHEAVHTMRAVSPRRQVVRNDKLDWEELRQNPDESEEGFILRLVKTTRNNLFHGGKYPDGPIAEVAHDKKILQAALKILEGCYELHPGIARWVEAA
jgi:hypothetical protein